MTSDPLSDIQLDFPNDYQNRFHIFYDLMEFNVKDVLLVSSLYDNFILEEDGRLSEEIYSVYSDLNLSIPPPRILRVASGTEAIEAVKKRHFDLIITMRRLVDIELGTFAKQIKQIEFDIPIVLLLTSHSEIPKLAEISDMENIDEVFVFIGDSGIFLAIIKIIEDKKNVDRDTKIGNVRVIIVIEDTIQYYSIFLPIIFTELLRQTQTSVEEGVNFSHKLLKRRGRPKILLAQTYEEAINLYTKYKTNVMGIISDIAFPREGVKDFSAGYDIAKSIRQVHKYLPVLLQSSDPSNYEKAMAIGVKFVHKNSPKYLRRIQKFFSESMLFGDFIFKDLEGKTISQASSISKFVKLLPNISGEVIAKHGSRNDFSNWLFARGEHQTAEQLASYTVSEFSDGDEIRDFLLSRFEQRRIDHESGIITEYSQDSFAANSQFIRFGNGSLGGKGRGLAFIHSLMIRKEITEQFPSIVVSIPQTIVICTDLFDQFMEENGVYDLQFSQYTDLEISEIFLSKKLPNRLTKLLERILQFWKGPIAVRSSSILEDSQFQPFAGIYKTFMLSNDQKKKKTRLNYLKDAIKLVYASTFSKLARTYVSSLGQKIEVEKMGIIIQKICGKHHSDRFYPDFSGVAKSFNFYPVSYQKQEDGVCQLAVGLGEFIVSGGNSLHFSPKYPKLLPQLSDPEYALKSTQTEFYALRLKEEKVNLLEGELSTLSRQNISVAKDDGILSWLASTFDYQNNRIVDSLVDNRPLIISFPYILKFQRVAITKLLELILRIGEESFGFDVEVEFAVNLDPADLQHQFKILQIRPLILSSDYTSQDIQINKSKSFVYSSNSLGNGSFFNVKDIVIVKPEKFENTATITIRDEIAKINNKLSKEGKEYTLIGPGRWGTRERFLGIPVSWSDVNNARVIIEIGLENFQVDPSQGMHFFINIVSTGKGYFLVPYNSQGDFIDWNYFDEMEVVEDLEYVKHIRADKPFQILLNGKEGIGAFMTASS